MPLVTPHIFIVGEVVTAATINAEIGGQFNELIGDRLFARKTANTSRPSTTTQTADPHLTLQVEASAVYTVEGYIVYDGASGGDINLDFNVPTSATGSWSTYAPGTGEAADGGSTGSAVRYVENNVDQARTYGTIAVGTMQAAHIRGLLITVDAGTYALSWAQASSSASATTVYAESWLRAWREA